jgi:hypothetical protein
MFELPDLVIDPGAIVAMEPPRNLNSSIWFVIYTRGGHKFQPHFSDEETAERAFHALRIRVGPQQEP